MHRVVARLCADTGARLGEGPSWDDRSRRLTWVDILAGRVHVCDAAGAVTATWEVGTHVGAALPAEEGGWLLATRAGFGLLAEDGTVSGLLDVHGDRPELRFNDAKCDPAGRALAGTMRYDEAPGDGTLYRLEPGPAAVPVLAGRGLCNGLGWSPDGRTLYFVDSLTGTVAGHAYDPVDGTVGPGRELIRVGPGAGMPDGLCVDDDGCIWVALHGGGCVRRYRPDGRLVAVIELPVRHPTSVAFGGPGRDHLFITTAGGTAPPAVTAGTAPPAVTAGTARPPATAPPAWSARPGKPAELGAGGLWVAEPGVSGPPATPWRPVRAHRDPPPIDDRTGTTP